jgi:NADPH:quinone reductase-like Zn-dependent oxidoreductase
VKAAVRDRYGAPDVVELCEVDPPVPGDGGVLVRVRACSVNPYDYHVSLAGRPYIARIGAGLRRPKRRGFGVDFAGTVEAVGRDVGRLQVGDEVYGFGTAAFAEYVHAGDAVTRKPADLSFEEAAAAPTAALTALQALRDKAAVRQGQRVVINGASGGVGTFAVQIAKAAGAEVTGVCSTAKVELVRSLGADHVVDHHREDFTRTGERYDLLIDNAGSHSWSALRRVLSDDATCVLVGGSKDNRWLGPLSRWATIRLAALGASQRVAVLLTDMRREDLDTLRELFEAGTLRAVIDRTYPLDNVADALRYVGAGHAPGKVVITIA